MGGAILAFLGGMRRGLSFRAQGGPTPAQLGGMLWLCILAVAALALAGPAGFVVPALVLLIVGHGSVAVLDPAASRRGEAPRFFARLRPVQMILPVASLAAVLARVVV